MYTEITAAEVEPRPIAVVRVTTVLSRWPREFQQPLGKVYEAVKAGKIQQTGHNVMVYRPRADRQVDIECGIECASKFEPCEPVVYSETPAGLVAMCTHVGPYGDSGSSHTAIVNWTRSNGHALTGICWEIYGDWNQDTAKLRTDLYHLLSR